MDEAVVLEIISGILTAYNQYQSGELTPDELKQAWQDTIDRVKSANQAFDTAHPSGEGNKKS